MFVFIQKCSSVVNLISSVQQQFYYKAQGAKESEGTATVTGFIADVPA